MSKNTKGNNKLTPNKIKDNKVNFVCHRCQRVYYQAEVDDFNESPKRTERQAYEYKKHYHSCKGRKINAGRKKA